MTLDLDKGVSQYLHGYTSLFYSGVLLLLFVPRLVAADEFSLVPLIENLPLSSSITMLPSNEILIVLREGGLKILAENRQTKDIALTPKDLFVSRQGGLIHLIPHPKYEKNGWLYLSYAAGSQKNNFLSVIRFRLQDTQVVDVQSIFRVAQGKDTPVHFGGKMVFDKTGNLLLTTGDGFDYREQAQVKQSHLGKVLRMSEVGMPIKSNPFFSHDDTRSSATPENYVFTFGHRNPQGLIVLNNGLIVLNEHGPAGGDEINVIASGVNYGWPVVTNGQDYIGASISPFKEYPGMRLPNVDWTPSIAPSSMLFYENDRFPSLSSKYLVTSLKFKNIYLVDHDFMRYQNTLFSLPQTRLRDILSTQNGRIFVLGDGPGASLYELTSHK